MEEWLHNACGRVSMLRSHHRAFEVEPGRPIQAVSQFGGVGALG